MVLKSWGTTNKSQGILKMGYQKGDTFPTKWEPKDLYDQGKFKLEINCMYIFLYFLFPSTKKEKVAKILSSAGLK